MNAILGLVVLCVIFLLYTNYTNYTNEEKNINFLDDYNKKINILENNLAEINLKIASLNKSDSNTIYAESVLTKYKEDIEDNIKNILLQLNSLVSKDVYAKENERVNLLLEQYKSTNSINSELVEKYTKEVKNIVDKISSIESKWTKLESDMFVELNGKVSINKLSELKQEILSNINNIISDNVKKEATDIINKSLENINNDVKSTSEIVSNTILSLDKLVENNKLNSKDIEIFKQDVYNKLTTYGNEFKLAKDEILKLKSELSKSINDYIEINTNRTKNIEDKLASEISANTTAFLEIRNSLKNVMTVIGDVDNLKYTPMLKNNVIDALYDLNSRLSTLEVKSKDIDALKSSVNFLLNSMNKQPTGFWDYHYVINSVAYTMNEIKKKLESSTNKNSDVYLDSLSKYKSIVNKFNNAYLNINNGGKSIIQLTIMQAVDELKYLIDSIYNRYTTAGSSGSNDFITISQEEYSLYNKEIDRARKEIETTQRELSNADYINNLQLSVNRLHSKSFISEEDISKLKEDIENLNISTSIKNENTLKSLEDLKTSISKLTISDNKINELDVVIKGLQANALQYYYTTNTVKSMEQILQNLTNWVGSWGDYYGSDTLNIYIKKMDEKIKSNKENTDSINLSLDKLKKLVGEYTLENNTSVADIAMKARDEAARVKAVIGLYDWNKNNGRSVSESLDNIASKIINIESTLGSLNPNFISSQTNSLLNTTQYLMDSFAKLTQEDKDIRAIISSLSADNSYINNYYFDLFKNTIGMPKRSETVYEILDKIDAELKILKAKGVQSDDTLTRLINMEKKYVESLNYTTAVNNYVVEVEKKVVEYKPLIDNLSNDLNKLKTDIATQNSRLTNYEKLQANVDLLNSTVNKIEADLEWKYIINSLEQISKYRTYMKNYVPLEKYNFIDSRIQDIIDNVKLISLQTYARSNEKFYTNYSKFNEMLTNIYNNHIIILTPEIIGNKEIYDVFWRDFGSQLSAYINVVNYNNTIDTRWNEPLWQYTQRKFATVYNDIQNMVLKFASKIDFDTLVGKTNTMETNINSSLAKIKEFDTKFTSLDASLSTLNSNINSSLDKIKQIDSKLTEVDTKFTGVETKFTGVGTRFNEMDDKLNKLIAGTTSATTGIGTFKDLNFLSSDINIPPVTLNPNNLTDIPIFICGFTLTNGIVTNGVLSSHNIGLSTIGLSETEAVNTVDFLEFYNILLTSPTNTTLVNNKFTYYSISGNQQFPAGRITDNNAFVSYLLNYGIYYKANLAVTSASSIYSGYNRDCTINSIRTLDNKTGISTVYKSEILTIVNSLIEYSRTMGATFSIYMGITYNVLNARSWLAAGNTIKGYQGRLYLDTEKSFINRNPTIVSDSLLDVSKKGLILNGTVIPNTTMNTAYNSSILNSTMAINMCPKNSYVCGVGLQYATNSIRLEPSCCGFDK